MAEVISFEPGGYRYIKAVFQYSSGTAAEPGFAVERACLRKPLPLVEGFAAVEAHLRRLGRPTTAFCACELRSPAPFTEQGFYDFNRHYVQTLERWGLYRDGDNPVARTNVCPQHEPPAVPSLYAFSYTVPAARGLEDGFVIAGSGETQPGNTPQERIVAHGDISPPGMATKMRHVMGEMERRLAALGFGWRDTTATQAYTVQDMGALIESIIVRRGAAPCGLTWHFARPPIQDLEFEMDVRAPAREIVL